MPDQVQTPNNAPANQAPTPPNQAVIDKLTDQKPAPQSGGTGSSGPAVNLDAVVQVGGKAHTVKELLDAQTALGTAQEEAKNLRAFREVTLALADENLQGDARTAKLREFYTLSGVPADEVEALVAEATDDGPSSGRKKPDPNEERLASLEEATQTERRNRVAQEITNLTSQGLDKEGGFKVLLDGLKARSGDKGEEAVTATRTAIVDSIKEATVSILRRKTVANNGKFQEAWVGPAVTEALQKELRKQRAVIAVFETLGRTTETEPLQFRRVRERQPIAKPKYTGQSGDDLDRELDAFLTDSLTRDAMKVRQAV